MAVRKGVKVSGGRSAARPRIRDTEPKKLQTKNATHKTPTTIGSVDVVDGQVFISCQVSELVPVAQFANVQLGPVQISWKLTDINMEELIDVDWGGLDEDGDITFDESSLTKEQRVAYNKIRGALRATSKVASHMLSEDRWLVEESIRLHNAREAAEEQKSAPKKPYKAKR